MLLRRLFVIVALLAPVFLRSAEPATNADFDKWADTFTNEYSRVFGAGRGGPGGGGGDAPAANTPSPADSPDSALEPFQVREQRQLALARKGLDELKRFSPDTLSPTQRVSAALFRWNLELTVTREPFNGH